MLLLLFAFLSGIVTILAPCIWPLLPIILSSSIAHKGKLRPLGITLGIIFSFAVFTLFISFIVKAFHFDPNVLRIIAVVILAILGIVMIVPKLNSFVEGLTSRLSGRFGSRVQAGNGFSGGFVTGLALGVIWSPCAGPILAAIATLAALGKITSTVILVTVAYVIGVGIPLLLFAYGGQQLVKRTRFLSQKTGRIQQVFGVIMLLTALAIYTNYTTVLLNQFPDFSNNFNQLFSNKSLTNQLNTLQGNQNTTQDTSGLLNANTPAPDFTGITKWLNTDKPLTIQALRGKVVLIDFWTYTCINCIRTLPHVTSWYEKYKDQGFVVVGVHTPEFAFEHEASNVQNAIKMFGIHYPVAQDNNYATWNAYNNQYWPAEYLIDTNGIIRRTHFGEGEYDQTEKAIQTLLKDAGEKVTTSLVTMPDQTPNAQLSPETYLGSNRQQYYYPSGKVPDNTSQFTLNKNIPTDSFTVGGTWYFTPEEALTEKNATLEYNFTANKVFLVLRPGTNKNGSQVKVLLDGKVIDSTNAGDDVQNGIINVTTDRLYNLVNLHGKTENHLLHIDFLTPGTEVYAFTFG
jgi:cytochrome c biogenesis protein CcdA/thiol-disulfide isomerase/thioredoxin